MLRKIILSLLIFILAFLISSCSVQDFRISLNSEETVSFQAERAFQDLIFQVNLGPRIPGTSGHEQIRSWITDQLENAGWTVEEQTVVVSGFQVRNLIAFRGEGSPYILLGAHYDTRIKADHDPDQNLRDQPVPGANDGASGVAVLLELARVLPDDLTVPVKLVFFDAEDNGGIGDWDWIMGSRAFVRDLQDRPQAAVIVDMVGDAELELYFESNSDPHLRESIWQQAGELGYGEVFIPEERHSMLDDHTPFLEAGIPAVDIIDFDYPYWHTTQDTVDKVSPESLKAVGDTLAAWLLAQQ